MVFGLLFCSRKESFAKNNRGYSVVGIMKNNKVFLMFLILILLSS